MQQLSVAHQSDQHTKSNQVAIAISMLKLCLCALSSSPTIICNQADPPMSTRAFLVATQQSLVVA